MESEQGEINKSNIQWHQSKTNIASFSKKWQFYQWDRICIKFNSRGSLFPEWHIHHIHQQISPLSRLASVTFLYLCMQLTRPQSSVSFPLGVTQSFFRCVNVGNQVSVKFCLLYNLFLSLRGNFAHIFSDLLPSSLNSQRASSFPSFSILQVRWGIARPEGIQSKTSQLSYCLFLQLIIWVSCKNRNTILSNKKFKMSLVFSLKYFQESCH